VRDEPPGDGGGEQRVALGDAVQGCGKLLRREILQQESVGVRAERLIDVLVKVEGGQDDDTDISRGRIATDKAGRLDAVELRVFN
jgi:hypothetical protein